MKTGTDLAQQINQQINQLPEDQKQALLEGIGGSIGNLLLKLVTDNISKWLQDPAIQKAIFDKLSELLTSIIKK